MLYGATYDERLNSSIILQRFTQNGIIYNQSYKIIDNVIMKDIISFQFGKGINNESIENSKGNLEIWLNDDFPEKFPEGHTNLYVRFNENKYPPVKNKEDLNSRKPLLENSMDYMLKVIYDATGLWPKSKGISIDDTD